MKEDLLQLFPMERRMFWKRTAMEAENIEEIRLRAGRPVVIKRRGREQYLDEKGNFTDKLELAYCAEPAEMEALLLHICSYSLYAFEDELKQGFITAAGGHRIGLAGQVVLNSDDSIRTVKHIYYMNIRVSHQVKGAADKVLHCLYQGEILKNTLIISPPGCGKTTLLRDLVRRISDGIPEHPGLCVGLVDERSEIAGSYMGHPQNDVGMRTDVLDACPKAQGMMMLLRSMAPQVIAVDELGGEEDLKALHAASSCGSRIIATLHGEDIRDALGKLEGSVPGSGRLFDLFLVLSREQGKPAVKRIYGKEEAYASFAGRRHDSDGLPGNRNLVPGTVLLPSETFKAAGRNDGNVDE